MTSLWKRLRFGRSRRNPTERPGPKYIHGGKSDIYEEVRHVKLEGILQLNIEDFLNWRARQVNDACDISSSQLELKFDENTSYKFQLGLKVTSRDDVNIINIYLLGNLKYEANLQMNVTMEALNKSGFPWVRRTKAVTFKPGSDDINTWNFPYFLWWEELKRKSEKRLPGGTLKIRCSLEVFKPQLFSFVENIVSAEESESNLTRDVAKLWKNPDFADINLKCDDKIFPCHKIILAARSDVFQAMFGSKSFSESITNETVIEDCKSEVLANLLKFIYTDKLEADLYNCLDLMMLADKYNVKKLRKKCERAIASSINCSNAVALLCTASNMEAPILLKSAAKFIDSNRKGIVGSEDWEKMVKTNSRAMDAIFKFGYR